MTSAAVLNPDPCFAGGEPAAQLCRWDLGEVEMVFAVYSGSFAL